MAIRKVRKVAAGATDLSGFKRSRHEKLEVAYGVITAASYTQGDTLTFGEVPAQDIIRATVVAHSGSPVVLEVYPGTDISSAIAMTVGSAPKVSYRIEYVRGTGAKTLKVTIN